MDDLPEDIMTHKHILHVYLRIIDFISITVMFYIYSHLMKWTCSFSICELMEYRVTQWLHGLYCCVPTRSSGFKLKVLSVVRICVEFYMFSWSGLVFSGYSSFLLQFKQMQWRWHGHQIETLPKSMWNRD